jgi:DNA repair protein RecN (Recombination protein N)
MFGGLTERTADVGRLHEAWREAERALKTHWAKVEEARREADWLRSSVDELEKLHPVEGEEEELAVRRSMMMKSEKMASDINEADEVLNGQGSPIPVISGLLRRLERKAQQAPELLNDTVSALDAALNALADAQTAVEAALRAADFNPRELEETEERLFALRGAARKYNVPVEALAELAARMVADLADLDAGEERLAPWKRGCERRRPPSCIQRQQLSERRHKHRRGAGRRGYGRTAGAEARTGGISRRDCKRCPCRADGHRQRSPFTCAPIPGSRPGPIMKVASGGELSRFLLALKVALADRGSAPTLVFDEIDTGVGGAVADAIGKRLKRLSAGVQVLSVTHAPQVAARAATHLLIAKGPSKRARRPCRHGSPPWARMRGARKSRGCWPANT